MQKTQLADNVFRSKTYCQDKGKEYQIPNRNNSGVNYLKFNANSVTLQVYQKQFILKYINK